MTKRLILAGALAFATLLAQAHDYTLGAIRIGHPWARATAPAAPAAGAYMTLSNAGAADRLLAVSAAVADSVELHTMSMDGNVMRMRKLEQGIELPAGQTVELKPGGLHVMFIGLKKPLKEGERFPLALRFEKAGTLTVEVKVEGMGAAPPAHEHNH